MGENFGGHRAWPTVCAWTLVCAAWLVIAWVWDAFHLTMTVDDTYYYFETARNIGSGLGSTFDGINSTDGYHPLWLAILVVLFKPFGDDMVLLTRIAFTLQVVMVWCGGLLLTRLRDVGGARILWPLALVLANPFAAKIVLCGQETALQFLLCCAALALWWPLRESGRGHRSLAWGCVALVCVLATLSRLDTMFLCGALLAMPLLLPSEAERSAGLAARLRTTVLGLGIFAALFGAFLVYRLATFHHLVPVSGSIKLLIDQDEIAPMAARIAVVVGSALGIAAWWLVAARTRSRVLALLAPPVASALVIAIYNFGIRGEMSPALVRIWYLEPFLLAGVLIIGALLGARHRLRVLAFVFAGAAALWLAFSVMSWRYRLERRSYSLYQAAERCARWIDEHAPPGAIGAAWDAGYVAAFTDRPVMNLDGLINSWDYKKKYLDPARVDEFILERQPVDFIIQYAWPRTIRAIAARFEHEPLPTAPQLQTSVTGRRDKAALSGRWGVDLTSFYVAHVECVQVSVAYDPTVTFGPFFYFVLRRGPLPGHKTLAEFALANRLRTSCEGFAHVD